MRVSLGRGPDVHGRHRDGALFQSHFTPRRAVRGLTTAAPRRVVAPAGDPRVLDGGNAGA